MAEIVERLVPDRGQSTEDADGNRIPASRPTYECSECGKVAGGDDNYCRWCGKKFKERKAT